MAEKEAEEKAKRQQRIMERNAKMGESEGPSQVAAMQGLGALASRLCSRE